QSRACDVGEGGSDGDQGRQQKAASDDACAIGGGVVGGTWAEPAARPGPSQRAGGVARASYAALASRLPMVLPSSEGFGATATPASCRISTFSSALSPKAEMMAPAWPIRRPLGAVRPAM